MGDYLRYVSVRLANREIRVKIGGLAEGAAAMQNIQLYCKLSVIAFIASHHDHIGEYAGGILELCENGVRMK